MLIPGKISRMGNGWKMMLMAPIGTVTTTETRWFKPVNTLVLNLIDCYQCIIEIPMSTVSE